MSLDSINAAIRTQTAKAEQITKDPSLNNVQKKSALNSIGIIVKNLTEQREILEQGRKIFGGVSGDALAASADAASYDPEAPRRGKAVPKLRLPLDAAREAYRSIKGGANFRAELGLKDAAASTNTVSELPPAFGGLVQKIHEPVRLLEILQSTSMSSPSIEYIRHDSTLVSSNALAVPVLSAPTTATTSGTLAAGTWRYVATWTTATGETSASNEISQVTTGSTSTVTFTIGAAPSGALGTKIYRTAVNGATGTETLIQTLGTTPTSFTDTGFAAGTAVPPAINGTGTAQMTSPGGAYVEATLNTTQQIASAKKIGIFTHLTDELLADFQTFAQAAEAELTRLITDQENFQLIQGNGTDPNLLGLLKTPGLLTRANPSAGAMIDTIEQSVADLRNGPSYCEPDVIVLHPNDWSLIRRVKTSQGAYILGDPGQTAVNDIWGIQVVTTTTMPQGTGLLMSSEKIGVAYVREGLTISMSNSNNADFTSGMVAVRADERLALAVVRPSAGLIITGIA